MADQIIFFNNAKNRHTSNERPRLAIGYASSLASFSFISMLAFTGQTPVSAVNDYVWNQTSTTWGKFGGNPAGTWNLNGAAAPTAYPGLPGSSHGTNPGGASTDIAEIAVIGAITSGNALGVNFGSTGNGVGTPLTLGALLYDPATGSSNSMTLGSIASTSGSLAFTGASLAGFSNVVVDNNSSSGGSFTIAPTGSSGSGALSVALASGTNNFYTASGDKTTISAVISGASSSVTAVGSGTLILSGTNTFGGGLVVSAGEIDAVGDANLGATSGSLTVNGGRLKITGSTTISSTRSILLGANALGSNAGSNIDISGTTVVYNGALQDLSGSVVGDFVKQGTGTLQLGGASSYSGNTFLNNGTIQLAAGGSLPSSTVLSLGQAGTSGSSSSNNVGKFDLGGFNQTVAGLNSTTYVGTGTLPGSNTVTTSTGTSTLTISGSGSYGSTSSANSGIITGSVAIAKTAGGTETFGGANTYTGGTTISGGTLQANAARTPAAGTLTSSSTGTGLVTVSGGVLAGTGGTGAVTVNGGTITAGSGATGSNTDTVGTLTTGNQTWTSGTFVDKVNGATGHDQLVMSGLVASSSFNISLQDLTSGATTPFGSNNTNYVSDSAPSNSTSYIVLATVPDSANGGPDANPFNPSSFSFNAGTVKTYQPGDSIQLATFDTGGGSGSYELIAEDVASPEPTSALLLGVVVSPLLLGRRRRAEGEKAGSV
jgi:autotransporter-associated beta strand protein